MDDNSMTLAVVILPPKSVTRYSLRPGSEKKRTTRRVGEG